MSERPWRVEVRTRPTGKHEPVGPAGEEWMPVRKPGGMIARFENEVTARNGMAHLERAQPHALFRVAMVEVGRRFRRRI